MGKHCCTFYGGERRRKGAQPPYDESYVKVQRLSARKYEVTIGLSEAECDRRELARKNAAALAKARERADIELSAMPGSHEQYRDQSAELLERTLDIHRNLFMSTTEYNGYSFDDETIEAFDLAAAHLVQILETGRTVYDPGRQKALNEGYSLGGTIDDLFNHGGALRISIEIVRAAGAERCETGRVSIATLERIGDDLPESGEFSAIGASGRREGN